VAGCCECGDEPSGSCATELVSYVRLGLVSGSNTSGFSAAKVGPQDSIQLCS
jgi:hypothetical protein